MSDHPLFATQLLRTPRLHEVSMMLIAALEKLFQAMEYSQFPVKEDLARRQQLSLSEALGFESYVNDQIKLMRELMMNTAF